MKRTSRGFWFVVRYDPGEMGFAIDSCDRWQMIDKWIESTTPLGAKD